MRTLRSLRWKFRYPGTTWVWLVRLVWDYSVFLYRQVGSWVLPHIFWMSFWVVLKVYYYSIHLRPVCILLKKWFPHHNGQEEYIHKVQKHRKRPIRQTTWPKSTWENGSKICVLFGRLWSRNTEVSLEILTSRHGGSSAGLSETRDILRTIVSITKVREYGRHQTDNAFELWIGIFDVKWLLPYTCHAEGSCRSPMPSLWNLDYLSWMQGLDLVSLPCQGLQYRLARWKPCSWLSMVNDVNGFIYAYRKLDLS